MLSKLAANASGINEVLKKGDKKRYCSLKKMQQIDKDFFRFPLLHFFYHAHTSLEAQLFDNR